MSNAPAGVVRLSVREEARAARAAARKLALLSNDARNSVLLDVAKRTEQNAARILAANGEDCKAAGELVRSGKLSEAAFTRLRVTEKTFREMVKWLEEFTRRKDPLEKRLARAGLGEELVVRKETCR